MRPAPSIRFLAADDWRTYKRLRLAALADAPESFKSKLADEEKRPDSEWQKRLASTADKRWNVAFVAEVEGEPAGLAWGRIEETEPEIAHVYQLWVAPDLRRRGAGRLLVEAVVEWARVVRARIVELGVIDPNGPAARLYRSAGFALAREPGTADLEPVMRLVLPPIVPTGLEAVLAGLRTRSGADAVLLVDRHGQLIGADRAGGQVGAAETLELGAALTDTALAQLEREGEVSIDPARGPGVHIAKIEALVLMVVFDESTTAERVRDEVSLARAELERLAREGV